MLRKVHLFTLPALVASVFLLTGCPPPYENEQWQRPSTTQEGVRAAMVKCGYQFRTVTYEPDNFTALRFQCMHKQGFTYKGGFDFCDVRTQLPACVAQKRGHELSLKELEALPFDADKGFYDIKPETGMSEYDQVSWRRKGASQHFSQVLENQKEAKLVMYQCGYPEPLGSNPVLPSIGRAAQVQKCMDEKGFEPVGKLQLVCTAYPQVTGCPQS